MILAGDIGGTKANLARVVERAGVLHVDHMRSYASQHHGSLEAILDAYLTDGHLPIERACFGVAGPVLNGEATVTNLPWRISEGALKLKLGGATVRVINDLEALAYGVPVLQPADLVTLQQADRQPGGAIAILAPGTGLGQGYLCWDGHHYRPGASEGGHTDFAPGDALQAQLLVHLHKEYGHVSWERVISGPGLHSVYRFLRLAHGEEEPPWVAERLASGDPSATISAIALTGADPVCEKALEVFTSAMGAQAGNLALTYMAMGGVYLGGGIPPKILPKLQDGIFLQAFRDKGRMSPLMKRFPVYVIQNSNASLLGAASYALTI